MNEAVIELEGATIANPRNAELPLLEPVDWRVGAGECWVVAGLQGSGKTTLLETVAGLHQLARGTLRLLGEPVPLGSGEALAVLRRRVGIVFEGSGRLFPSLTVLENVMLPLRYHHDLSLAQAAAELAPLVAALHVERLSNFLPAKLTRAWSRRVALARALALRPEVLLLDNPLEGLDATHLRWWRGFLEELRAGHPWFGGRPVTLLIATDELRPLLHVGQWFALAGEGRWRILGDRAAVLADPEPAVRELLGEGD